MIGRRHAGRTLVRVLAFGLLPTAALAGENAEAIKEFGVSKGEPIDEGFFFRDWKYVEAPYVVERRGLALYVNDELVRPGGEWPPYDLEVEEDPGDPPDDSLPWDPPPPGVDRRDGYWARKGRYLTARLDREAARKAMVEAYRRSPAVREVYKHPDKKRRNTYVVVTRSGREVGVFLVGTRKTTPGRDALLAFAEQRRSNCEGALRRGGLLLFSGGHEMTRPGAMARKMLEILLSEAPDEEKLLALSDCRLIRHEFDSMREMVARFEGSAQLLERLGGKRLTAEEFRRKFPPQGGSKTPGLQERKLPVEDEAARAEQRAQD